MARESLKFNSDINFCFARDAVKTATSFEDFATNCSHCEWLHCRKKSTKH